MSHVVQSKSLGKRRRKLAGAAYVSHERRKARLRSSGIEVPDSSDEEYYSDDHDARTTRDSQLRSRNSRRPPPAPQKNLHSQWTGRPSTILSNRSRSPSIQSRTVRPRHLDIDRPLVILPPSESEAMALEEVKCGIDFSLAPEDFANMTEVGASFETDVLPGTAEYNVLTNDQHHKKEPSKQPQHGPDSTSDTRKNVKSGSGSGSGESKGKSTILSEIHVPTFNVVESVIRGATNSSSSSGAGWARQHRAYVSYKPGRKSSTLVPESRTQYEMDEEDAEFLSIYNENHPPITEELFESVIDKLEEEAAKARLASSREHMSALKAMRAHVDRLNVLFDMVARREKLKLQSLQCVVQLREANLSILRHDTLKDRISVVVNRRSQRGLCQVCFEPGDGTMASAVQVCHNCGVTVHPACYGPGRRIGKGWQCDYCFVQKGSTKARGKCEMCSVQGGALKRTRGSKWIHAACALFMPDVQILPPSTPPQGLSKGKHMSISASPYPSFTPIINGYDVDTSAVKKSRKNHRCCVCKKYSGSCVFCDFDECDSAFHVLCAFKAGLYIKSLDGNQPRLPCLKIPHPKGKPDLKDFAAFCLDHTPLPGLEPMNFIEGMVDLVTPELSTLQRQHSYDGSTVVNLDKVNINMSMSVNDETDGVNVSGNVNGNGNGNNGTVNDFKLIPSHIDVRTGAAPTLPLPLIGVKEEDEDLDIDIEGIDPQSPSTSHLHVHAHPHPQATPQLPLKLNPSLSMSAPGSRYYLAPDGSNRLFDPLRRLFLVPTANTNINTNTATSTSLPTSTSMSIPVATTTVSIPQPQHTTTQTKEKKEEEEEKEKEKEKEKSVLFPKPDGDSRVPVRSLRSNPQSQPHQSLSYDLQRPMLLLHEPPSLSTPTSPPPPPSTKQLTPEMIKEAAKGDRLRQQQRFDDMATCSICNIGESFKGDSILFCDGCNLPVHQSCYGVPKIPEGDWFCDRCAAGAPRVHCALCPIKTGAFKRSAKGDWVHVVCALWMPGVYFEKPETMEMVQGIKAVDPARFRMTCSICRKKDGACIQCHERTCAVPFHAGCIRRSTAGYMKVIQTGLGKDDIGYYCFCKNHKEDGIIEVFRAEAEAVHAVGEMRRHTPFLVARSPGGPKPEVMYSAHSKSHVQVSATPKLEPKEPVKDDDDSTVETQVQRTNTKNKKQRAMSSVEKRQRVRKALGLEPIEAPSTSTRSLVKPMDLEMTTPGGKPIRVTRSRVARPSTAAATADSIMQAGQPKVKKLSRYMMLKMTTPTTTKTKAKTKAKTKVKMNTPTKSPIIPARRTRSKSMERERKKDQQAHTPKKKRRLSEAGYPSGYVCSPAYSQSGRRLGRPPLPQNANVGLSGSAAAASASGTRTPSRSQTRSESQSVRKKSVQILDTSTSSRSRPPILSPDAAHRPGLSHFLPSQRRSIFSPPRWPSASGPGASANPWPGMGSVPNMIPNPVDIQRQWDKKYLRDSVDTDCIVSAFNINSEGAEVILEYWHKKRLKVGRPLLEKYQLPLAWSECEIFQPYNPSEHPAYQD